MRNTVVTNCVPRLGSSASRASATARVRRVCPSASARRMLRDASISTGTSASRDPAGGRNTIGLKRNNTRAGSKPILRPLGLQLFRQRRLEVFERLRRLAAQVLPFRKILLERFGPGSRDGHRRRLLEREPAAAAFREGGIVPSRLIDEILRLP